MSIRFCALAVNFKFLPPAPSGIRRSIPPSKTFRLSGSWLAAKIVSTAITATNVYADRGRYDATLGRDNGPHGATPCQNGNQALRRGDLPKPATRTCLSVVGALRAQ